MVRRYLEETCCRGSAPGLPSGAMEDILSSQVQLSERAAERVRQLLARDHRPAEAGLRLGVADGGCSGLQYTLKIDDEALPDDSVFESAGVRVFVDRPSLGYLAGMVVDYADGLHAAGFRFTNPNADRTCGCGTSFSVPK